MSYTIGRLSALSGTSVQTIRFYEKETLLPPPRRNGSGYRQYDDDSLARLNFIRRSQQLGFTLREIGELIALQNRRDADCGDVRAATRQKLDLIERKAADLLRMKAALEALVSSCQGSGPLAGCAILECLSAPEVGDALNGDVASR